MKELMFRVLTNDIVIMAIVVMIGGLLKDLREWLKSKTPKEVHRQVLVLCWNRSAMW